MLILRATKKLRQRIGPPTVGDAEDSTTLLGDWYATALPWRPQVALLVNETTLLPVLMPLAPAATMTTRICSRSRSVWRGHRAVRCTGARATPIVNWLPSCGLSRRDTLATVLITITKHRDLSAALQNPPVPPALGRRRRGGRGCGLRSRRGWGTLSSPCSTRPARRAEAHVSHRPCVAGSTWAG
jgi:hypothetical protein